MLEWFLPVFSEPEPGVGGAGSPPASVQPHLRPSALLGSDPDPHLPGLPGHGFRLGATAELVREVDPSVQVSERRIKANVVPRCNPGSQINVDYLFVP